MGIKTEKIIINTKGFTDIIDITKKVESIVYKRDVKEATVFVFVIGSTASITTIEYENGLLKDLPQMYDELISPLKNYNHNKKWLDDNGYSHLRSTITGTSVSIPLYEGKLQLGFWQQIVLIDFDNKPRSREIIIQILY